MKNKEIWKPIEGFENIYEISTYGRIKSYKKHGGGLDSKSHLLKQTNKNGGYFSVVLLNPITNLKKSYKIHRIVYETFKEKIPEGFQIHHKDGNKQNNYIDNLEAVSRKEHNKITMSMNPDHCKGMNMYNKYEKTKEIYMFDLDGNYLASFPNAVIASNLTGVCRRDILLVANKSEYAKGKYRKQAGGYYWSFEKDGFKSCR